MGRAKGISAAITVSGFDQVMGKHRGKRGETLLTPSQRIEEDTAIALSVLETGDLDSTIDALRRNPEETFAVPVKQSLIDKLSEQAYTEWSPTVSALFGYAGIGDTIRSRTLVHQKKSAVIHVWPDGENLGSIYHMKGQGTTLCGRQFDEGEWRQGMRGDANDTTRNSRHTFCKRCSKLASNNPQKYWEAFESKMDDKSTLTPTDMTNFRQLLALQMQPAVDSIIEGDNSVDWSNIIDRTARNSAVDLASQKAQSESLLVFANTVDRLSHRQGIAQDLGYKSSGRGLQGPINDWAGWVTTMDWQALFNKYMPKEPVANIWRDQDQWCRDISKLIVRLGQEEYGRKPLARVR